MTQSPWSGSRRSEPPLPRQSRRIRPYGVWSCSTRIANSQFADFADCGLMQNRESKIRTGSTPWCNGNTAPFGGVIHGSNPCGVARVKGFRLTPRNELGIFSGNDAIVCLGIVSPPRPTLQILFPALRILPLDVSLIVDKFPWSAVSGCKRSTPFVLRQSSFQVR